MDKFSDQRGRCRGRAGGRPRGRGRAPGRGQSQDREFSGNERGRGSAHNRWRRGGHQETMRRWQSSEILGSVSVTKGRPPQRVRGKTTEFYQRSMGFNKLNELSGKENCQEIALELTSSRSGFQLLLNLDTIKPDWMDYLFQILEKVCNSTHRESVLHILSIVCASLFIEKHIMKFLTDALSTPFRPNMVEKLNRIMFLYTSIYHRLPSSAEKCVGSLVIMKAVFDMHQVSMVQPEMEQKREELYEMCKAAALVVKEEATVAQQRRKRRDVVMNADEDAPPDDFRQMTLFPDIVDLQLGKDVFLRKNKDKGAYPDLSTYLDIQFRLLREDYIQPLRKGIQEYKNCLKRGEPPKKMTELRLYYDVHIMGSICNEDVETRLRFDTSNTRKIRWQSSKRLIYGSLVGLTQDDFETIIFATVTNRHAKDLENGIIQVRFESNIDVILRATAKDSFIMAETTAYFEAYKHVLYRLQEIDNEMPFQKYILHCNSQVGPPKYFFENSITYYNLGILSKGFPDVFQVLRSVPVVKTVRWPDPSLFNLDLTQLDAVKTALSKELAIIQGPPGTGKTYVGLKIAQVLFENRDTWVQQRANNAILVVCYTNHALDQFLEGIALFLKDGIVRVGGRSSSEELKKFNLKNLRTEIRKERKVRIAVKENSVDCKRVMSTLRQDIEEVSSRIEACSFGILHEWVLEQVISAEHYNSLLRKSKTSVMQIWLGFEASTVREEGQPKQFLIDHWVKAILYTTQYAESQGREKHVDVGKVLRYKLVKRVKLYQGWILQFRCHIQKKISEAEANYLSGKEDDKRLQGLWFQSETSYNEILSDIYLRPFVPPTIFRAIRNEKHSQFEEGFSIKVWLGASQKFIEGDLTTAIQELQESYEDEFDHEVENDVTGMDEEADIMTAQRFVDDKDNIFQTKSGSSAFLLEKSMETVALSMKNLNTVPKLGKKGKSDGWEVQFLEKKKLKKHLEKILKSLESMSEEEVSQVGDVWALKISERTKLYKYWVLRYQDCLKESIQGKEQMYRKTAYRLKEVLLEEDRDIMEEAKFIGMTTTGAAKHATLLQAVGPRIIIVEEAAEVLESHIITTLNAKCQHLILIGDHQQLRPNPTVHELAKTYNLDISLFERLIKNQMPHVTLSLQHRMRPEISILMKHIYPDLRDHESVTGFPNVLGMEKNVFFVHHEYQEQQQDETKSKTNEHEASFIVALCRYFLLQGYKPSEIAILAAYTGQILLIKRHMSKMIDMFKGVRLTSVDNFQGEENKIVLLSFVRSNEEGSVGFLGIDNRVCVALSRAREGLFAVGNFKLLAQKSTLWANIVETLKNNKNIGLSLRLRCQNHPGVSTEASSASDFSGAPEGGCTKPCDLRLSCGHVCERICHNVNRKHKGFKCQKTCQRPLPNCDHPCKGKCYEKCAKCQVPVLKKIPMCDHKNMVPCSKEPHTWICTQRCQGSLTCGHQCQGMCGQCRSTRHTVLCKEKVERIWPCGHIYETECHKVNPSVKCTRLCTTILDCGHKCKGSCSECLFGKVHKSCTKKCKKKLPCSHSCQQQCGAECLPCTLQCTVECTHSGCRNRCGQVCQPCKEPCDGGCKHYPCSKLCSDMCNNEICNLPCEDILPCGHKCIGVCAEPCVCRECNEGKLTGARSQPCEQPETFILLKECGHIYSKEFLDKLMLNTALPSCPEPKCQKVIKESVRYANYMRIASQQIQNMKKKLWMETQRMGERVSKLRKSMAESSLPITTIQKLTDILDKDPNSLNVVKSVENQFKLSVDLNNIQSVIPSSTLKGPNVAKELDELQDHLMQKKAFMSDQMIREYKAEIRRLMASMETADGTD